MNKVRQRLITITIVIVLQNAGTFLTFAHEGYITTYNHHIIKGELEFMLMNDFTRPSGFKQKNDGHKNHLSQMVELEYAPSRQLAFEFMMEGFQDIGTGEKKFTGFRYEMRTDPFKGKVPLNPTFYMEYEDLHVKTRYKMEVSGWIDPPYLERPDNSNRERILESRLILSHDFNFWNVAFNWINESDLKSGEIAFGYSFGFLYHLFQHTQKEHSHHGDHSEHGVNHTHQKLLVPVSLSFEFIGALGDTREFALSPYRQEHYFQPSIMLHIGGTSMVSIGAGLGLTKTSDNIIRLCWGRMF